jgi:hypothetical protein
MMVLEYRDADANALRGIGSIHQRRVEIRRAAQRPGLAAAASIRGQLLVPASRAIAALAIVTIFPSAVLPRS